MIGSFNDRQNLNLLLSVLFLLGIGASLYFIYSLPSGLHLTAGFGPKFLPVYSVVGVTFALGVITILSAMAYKKEVVVFRDRVIDAQTDRETADQGSKTTISLESVKSTLQQSGKDTLQTTLQVICKQLDAGQGALYLVLEEEGKRFVQLQHGYALNIGESTVIRYEFGEGLIGQTMIGGKTIYIDDVPNGYIKILSGLGSASPRFLLIVPVKKQDQQPNGVIEIASFTALSEDQRKFVEESAQLIAEKI
jgi:methyl-accepting chemotaxis protein